MYLVAHGTAHGENPISLQAVDGVSHTMACAVHTILELALAITHNDCHSVGSVLTDNHRSLHSAVVYPSVAIAVYSTVMVEQIGIRLNGTVYLYRMGDGDVLRLWVSQQSLLPLTPTNHTVLMVGQTNGEPYTVNDYTRVPILCDRAFYTGRPIAKLTYKPTNYTIPLYPSREWLDYLHAHIPIIIHHNERFWVFTNYDSDTVQLYRERGGRWDNTYRCWVFRELPSATQLQNAPICPLFSLLSPV